MRACTREQIVRLIEIGFDFALIQETHFEGEKTNTKEQRSMLPLHEDGRYAYIKSDKNSASAGVAIVYNKLKFVVTQVEQVIQGYFLLVRFKAIQTDRELIIGCLYSPSAAYRERVDYIEEVARITRMTFQRHSDILKMVGGDWNMYSRKQEHHKNKKPKPFVRRAFNLALSEMECREIVTPTYTWSNNGTQHSVLDRFIGNYKFVAEKHVCEVIDPERMSDHAVIKTVIQMDFQEQPRSQAKREFYLSNEYVEDRGAFLNNLVVAKANSVVYQVLRPVTRIRLILENIKQSIKDDQKQYFREKQRDANRERKIRKQLQYNYKNGITSRRALYDELMQLRDKREQQRRKKAVFYSDNDTAFIEEVATYKRRVMRGSNSEELDYEEAIKFYTELYNKTEVDEVLEENIEVGRLSEDEKNEIGGLFTEAEIRKTIKACKNKSAAGLDGYTFNLFKAAPATIPLVTAAINSIWNGEEILEEQDNKAYITLIYKAGDKKMPGNYRPISVTNCLYRIMAKAVAERLQKKMKKIVGWQQTGFIKERDIRANIYFVEEVLRLTREMDQLPEDTQIELKKFLTIISLDFRKAYDSVKRCFVIRLLKRANLPPGMIRFVEASFNDTRSCFKLPNGEFSAAFDVTTGVKQGDPLSPLLFAIATEPLRKLLQEIMEGGITPHTNVGLRKIISMLYADDIVLFSSKEEGLEILLTFARLSGLNLNVNKCAQMTSRFEENEYIFQAGEIIKLLGCSFNNNGIMRDAIFNKILLKCSSAINRLNNSWIAKCSVFTRAITFGTFVEPIYNYYMNFVLLSDAQLDILDKMAIKFMNVRTTSDVIFLDKNRGGLGLRRAKKINLSIAAHWIIRAHSSTDEWAEEFKRTIQNNLDNRIRDVNNGIVKNAVIAWKHLNLGPVDRCTLKTVKELKQIVNRSKKCYDADILNATVRRGFVRRNTYVVKDPRYGVANLHVGANPEQSKFVYLEKMALPSKVKQLRWLTWLNPNYVYIKRQGGVRIRCSNCRDDKVSLRHMMVHCVLAKRVKKRFCKWVKAVVNIHRPYFSRIWDRDRPPNRVRRTANSYWEGIDTFMCIVKFEIWKRFTKYMFGGAPNVFMDEKSIFKIAIVKLKESAREHKQTTDAGYPAGWNVLFNHDRILVE